MKSWYMYYIPSPEHLHAWLPSQLYSDPAGHHNVFRLIASVLSQGSNADLAPLGLGIES